MQLQNLSRLRGEKTAATTTTTTASEWFSRFEVSTEIEQAQNRCA